MPVIATRQWTADTLWVVSGPRIAAGQNDRGEEGPWFES